MKTVIGIIVGIVSVFSVVAMYCAMVVEVAPTRMRTIAITTKEMTAKCF